MFRLLLAVCGLALATQLPAQPMTVRFGFRPLKNPATFGEAVPDPAAHYVNGRPRNYYDGRALRPGEVSGTIFVRPPAKARLDTQTRVWEVQSTITAGRRVWSAECPEFKLELHGAPARESNFQKALLQAFGKNLKWGS